MLLWLILAIPQADEIVRLTERIERIEQDLAAVKADLADLQETDQDASEYHVRSLADFAELEPTENARIHVYGKIDSVTPVWLCEKIWADGVELIGHDDAEFGSNVNIWPFLGYDDITIRDIKALAAFRDYEWNTGRAPIPNPDNRSRNVLIQNCEFIAVDIGFSLSTGNDNWTFSHCKMSGGKHGLIYAQNYKTNGAGPSNLLIEDCEFRDTNTGDNKEQYDGHAIGLQKCNDVTIRRCKIRDCNGTAIEAWLGGGETQTQKNIVIENCDIRGCKRVYTDGRGIAFSGGNRNQVMGNRTGCRITNNAISNTEGNCISCNVQDPVEIAGNELHQPWDLAEEVFFSFQYGPNPQIPTGNTVSFHTQPVRVALIRYGKNASKFAQWDHDANELIDFTLDTTWNQPLP